jgi:hypothetical protein
MQLKYSVLLYLSTMQENDAKGFGALEHPTATTVVLPELMPKEELVKSMMDVVSHEFSYRNPLSIHSKSKISIIMTLKCQSIYGCMKVLPNISQSFQINQGLITEEDFITAFQTKWSAQCNERHHVFYYNECKRVETAHKDQYINVYRH